MRTIVLNICEGFSVPRWPDHDLEYYSALRSSSLLSISRAAKADRRLCIRHTSVYVCVCVFISQLCLCQWVSESESGFCFIIIKFKFLRGGSGPRGRRFRCCQHFPWRSSVVLTLPFSLPSNASWLPAAACPQQSPRSCPSLLTAAAWTASLAQMMEAACFHPEKIMSQVEECEGN